MSASTAPSLRLQRPSLRGLETSSCVATAIIIVIGLVHLPNPFHDDQAFFTVGAWKINQGAVLYRDYWDIKQPGIFAFFWAAGKLFGFNEVGIHGFELLYMMGFTVVLIMALGNYFDYRWSSGIAALLTVGFYYAVSGVSPYIPLDFLTQVEGLVGFPMFLTLWFSCRATRRSGKRAGLWFASGIMGGLVLVFKLMFLPIILAFWIAAFWYCEREAGRFRHTVGAAVSVLLGLLIPNLVVCAYFARHSELKLLFFSSFVWPVQAIGKLPLPGPGRLVAGLGWFVEKFAPLLALSFIGTLATIRRSKDILTIDLLLWIVVGSAVILIEVRSWWSYHYLLLLVPIGILATRGVEFLWSRLYAFDDIAPRQRQLVFTLTLALLFAPVVYSVLTNIILLAHYKFAVRDEERLNYQCKYPGSMYLQAPDAGFLSKRGSVPGPIYADGTSMYYYLSGRQPAVALSGSLDDFLPDQWVRFTSELLEARPPYIFLSPPHQESFQKSAPAVLQFIKSNYDVLDRREAGTWYILKTGSRIVEKSQLGKVALFRTPSQGCLLQRGLASP